MHDSAVWSGAASLEDRHVVAADVLQRSFEPLLCTRCPLGVDRLDPLGGGTAVRCQKARLHAVPVELPACIVADALQPYINEVPSGDASKSRDEIINIPDQQVAHVSGRHTNFVQMRFHRTSKVAGQVRSFQGLGHGESSERDCEVGGAGCGRRVKLGRAAGLNIRDRAFRGDAVLAALLEGAFGQVATHSTWVADHEQDALVLCVLGQAPRATLPRYVEPVRGSGDVLINMLSLLLVTRRDRRSGRFKSRSDHPAPSASSESLTVGDAPDSTVRRRSV